MRRLKPHRRLERLTRRADSELAWASDEPLIGGALILDTSVYLDVLTGFVVPGEAEAVEAIGRLSELDRRQVRRHFEKRFTTRRMAQEYLRHYKASGKPNAGDLRSTLSKDSVPERPLAP